MSNNIKIKNTDLVLSKIGFGTVNAGLAWDNEDAFEILERYINLGGNVIDCARIYSDWVEPEIGRAERVIGDWIKRVPIHILHECFGTSILIHDW